MEAHINIRNLNAWYGDHQALKDVNLEIPRQQITVIMGPSGCGKTTLLKSLNRFLELTDGARITGQVLIDSEDIYASGKDVTEIRKKAGLLAQRPYPLPMSIFDNVAYGMRIHKMHSGQPLKHRVEHYLTEAGLWEEVRERLNAPVSSRGCAWRAAWRSSPRSCWATNPPRPSTRSPPSTSRVACKN
jgi:phosphate transport system ATP-binding protein